MIETEHDAFRRPRPSLAYRPSGLRIQAPRNVLPLTIAALRSVGRREGVCLWLGTRSANHAQEIIVEAVVVPKQVNQLLNFTIPASANQEVGDFARARGFKIAAAVHSHPGSDVEHSEYDDKMTSSRRALSIVFPDYGYYDPAQWPSAAGIHEYVDGYWHLLTDAQARQPLSFDQSRTAAILDLR